jgi:hypothetical protein
MCSLAVCDSTPPAHGAGDARQSPAVSALMPCCRLRLPAHTPPGQRPAVCKRQSTPSGRGHLLSRFDRLSRLAMAQRGNGRSARTCRSRFAPAPERGAQPTVLSRRDSVVFPRPPPQETVSTRKGTARSAPSQARVYLPRLPLRRGPGRRPRCLPCGRRRRLASRMRRRSALRCLRSRDATLPCLGGETLCGSGAGSALRRRKGLRRR